jgi:hypothetical protein
VIRRWGLEIAGIVGIGTAVALGLAGMHGPSAETWASVMLLAICGVLMLSVIGAVCRGPGDRPRLLGFAVFGWGYFILARWYSYYEGPMPTDRFVPGSGDLHSDLLSLPPPVRIAHDAWALAFAVLGGTLTGLFFKDSAVGTAASTEGARPDRDVVGWWGQPAFVGLMGSGVVVAVALAGWRSDPDTTAGAIFLLTWALAGLVVLGAILARGRRREAWLGAAGFGLGYLLMAFSPVGSPQLPTNHFLNAVYRPEGPTATGEVLDEVLTTDEESQRVRKALDEPISLHFREDTSLKVVLEHIKDAIRGPLGKPLHVYAGGQDFSFFRIVDLEPLLVSIDREDIPAKEALRLCLSPLGLTYRVQSGYVRIYPDAYQPVPYEEDPVMIAGHSLLALIAAAIGGVAAPIIAGFCGRHGWESH